MIKCYENGESDIEYGIYSVDLEHEYVKSIIEDITGEDLFEKSRAEYDLEFNGDTVIVSNRNFTETLLELSENSVGLYVSST